MYYSDIKVNLSSTSEGREHGVEGAWGGGSMGWREGEGACKGFSFLFYKKLIEKVCNQLNL